MVNKAYTFAQTEKFSDPGDLLIIVADMPFGQSDSTNMIRIARVQ